MWFFCASSIRELGMLALYHPNRRCLRIAGATRLALPTRPFGVLSCTGNCPGGTPVDVSAEPVDVRAAGENVSVQLRS